MNNHNNKAFLRAGQGAIASFGAPCGWLVIRFFQGAELIPEITNNQGLYAYMLGATLITFMCFGWYVGNKERMVELLSIRDALTGLYNVRFFRERLTEEIITAVRENTALTLILFDLDHFKRVNDAHGHAVGDQVLVAISQSALKILRKHEVLARVGGEEFTVLLPRCSASHSREMAERLREEIAATKIVLASGQSFGVTVSLGVANFTLGDDAKTLYQKADTQLYQAKNNGRNRVEIG